MFIFEKHDLQKGGYVCFCKKCGLIKGGIKIKRVGFKPLCTLCDTGTCIITRSRSGGGTQVWFGRDVPPRNLKVDHTNTSFSRKSNPFIYQSAQFWAKF